MIETADIVVSLAQREDREAWKRLAARRLKCHPKKIRELRLLKESIDARKAPVKFQLRLQVGLGEPLPEVEVPRYEAPAVGKDADTIVIVGCGPAGMFAALRCLELGLKPIIVERGTPQYQLSQSPDSQLLKTPLHPVGRLTFSPS